MIRYNKHITAVIAVLFALSGFSQKTIVFGTISDAKSGDPLPFVNVAFQDSKIGTSSDIDGNFRIETYYATDSISATFVGYKPQSFKVKKDKEQEIHFKLNEGAVQLKTVEIKYDRKKDKNPAHEMLKKVIRHKDANNREKLEAYEYEAYNKVEFDVNNIDDEYKNKRVFKPFQFIFENIDTTDGKPYLPIFITEALSEFYYKKFPKSQREIIKATNVSGLKNESVQQFMGDMYQNVNVYDNYITVFGKNFVSPVADFGLISYHYYIVDSAYLDSKWCYKLKFTPRREHELNFDGSMWISDTTYAVKEIEATVSGSANINFINDFSVKQEYNEVEPEVWMLTKDELLVDFELSKSALGFYGRKTSSYQNFVINQPKAASFFDGAENIIVADSAGEKTAEFWDDHRHLKLTEKEKEIYHMIDTLKQVPAFRSYVDVIQLFVTGYKVWGNVELGPYFSAYSFNQVEGHRFRLGGRTSNAFSTRLMIDGYAAYGTTDQNFKYGGGFQYFLSKKPRQSVSGSYKHDVEQLGVSENAWSQDNIISSVFRRTPFDKLSGFQEFNLSFEREWVQGFSNVINLKQKEIWPLGALRFEKPSELGIAIPVASIYLTEVSLSTRFAYKEKFVSGEFSRMSLGTKYPVIQTKYTYGIPRVFNSDYEYHKLKVNISDKFRIGMIGETDVIVEGGKIWTALPFPILQLHNGNETYAYDAAAFNLMNYYEFVSDEYVSASVTHHFNGLFLNKIPLLRKLKWREVVSGKGVMGSLNPRTHDIMILPSTLSTLTKPYYEAGVGIENIFQLLRIDLLWRLAYTDKDYVTTYESLSTSTIAKWGIRGMLQFKF